jgi:hypothetical protein
MTGRAGHRAKPSSARQETTRRKGFQGKPQETLITYRFLDATERPRHASRLVHGRSSRSAGRTNG